MILRHRSHRLARALAAAVAAAALAAPPALARIDPPATPAFNSESVPRNEPVVVRAVDDGFDWGAAAIGAGGAGVLVALVALVGFADTSRNRTRAAP